MANMNKIIQDFSFFTERYMFICFKKDEINL